MFIVILVLVAILVFCTMMLFFKEELTESAAIGICLLLVLAGIILGGHRPIPRTDATRDDIRDMIEECEASLPRNQNCVIDIGVRPEGN